MKISNFIHLHVSKDEKDYTFSCANDSPLGEVFDALCQMRNHVYELIKTEHEKDKPKENKEDAAS